MWLIWSTPWSIAGGRIQLDGTMPWANVDHPSLDGFQNGLTNASIHWNLGNGLHFDESVGVYWAAAAHLPIAKSRFLGHIDVAYIAGGWALSANFIYGSEVRQLPVGAPSYLNFDLRLSVNSVSSRPVLLAYSTMDLQNGNNIGAGAACAKACEQSQFAVGGLVGYDFGSFSGNFKLTQVVSESNYDYAPGQGYKNTTAWLTIVKPLWNPASEGPLK